MNAQKSLSKAFLVLQLGEIESSKGWGSINRTLWSNNTFSLVVSLNYEFYLALLLAPHLDRK